MAIKSIPVRGNLPNHSFTIDLDKVVFKFEFKWNERVGLWSFDLMQENGTPIVMGVPVVVNWPLLSNYGVSGLPLGSLVAWDSSGMNQEIQTLTELGDRVLLIYEEALRS